MPDPYQTSQSLPEYDAMRRRLQGQFAQKKQEGQDALQRRFAANGMLNSGAYEKTAQLQDQNYARDEADATSQLDLAQAQEMQRRKEVQEGRDFARQERIGSQQFASGEREAGQQFASGERQATQLFNKQLFDADMAFKEKVRAGEDYWRKLENQVNFQNNKVSALLNAVGDDFGNAKLRHQAQTYLDSVFGKNPFG